MKLLIAMCLLGACLGGCAARPLSDSEFRGFCYTTIETRFASCDTIEMCNDFDTNAVSMEHKSRQDCAVTCGAVYDRLYRDNLFNGCSATLVSAYNWCMKYCNTNYPK